jgi:predicted ATPase
MMDDQARQEVFEALLEEAERARAFPEEKLFRVRLEQQRDVIDALVREGAIRRELRGARIYVPTLAGLRAHRSALAERILRETAALLPILQEIYRRAPLALTSIPELVKAHGLDTWSVQRSLELLDELPMKRSMQWRTDDGVFIQIELEEAVLDRAPADVLGTPEIEAMPGDAVVMLKRIEIDGYRPFRDFTAELGSLTVMIGANAAGKSALLDFLQFASDAVNEPLPPEIDRGSIGKALFHAGGPAKIAWSMTVDLGRLLRYEVEILGPVGAPRVARERLATAEPTESGDARPALFLDFRAGSGTLRDPGRSVMVPAPWPAIPNELALRRMIDPRYTAVYRLREAMSKWRVYTGFDVSAESPIRQPAITESEPVLAESGHNLSAVLLWLQTEHRDVFAELETHLRSVIPSFRALQIKLMGGRGRAMATWLEDGVADDLTLADLSDGTLRFLGWATLCLAPNPPSLICMDEPEIGLHPRVLPVLAGLCQRASEQTQVLLTTHSPYFLAQFDLDDIAVMRREDGRAVFARPGSSASLRAMIEEIGGDELMRMHVSDELETLA